VRKLGAETRNLNANLSQPIRKGSLVGSHRNGTMGVSNSLADPQHRSMKWNCETQLES
jgi:hypothetical protein